MNSNQKLRFVINEYGKWLKIEDLYSKMKEKVFKVKNANEMSEKDKESIIQTFKYWLQALEQGVTSIEDAKSDMISKLK